MAKEHHGGLLGRTRVDAAFIKENGGHWNEKRLKKVRKVFQDGDGHVRKCLTGGAVSIARMQVISRAAGQQGQHLWNREELEGLKACRRCGAAGPEGLSWHHAAWTCSKTADDRPRTPTDGWQLRLGWPEGQDSRYDREVLEHLANTRVRIICEHWGSCGVVRAAKLRGLELKKAGDEGREAEKEHARWAGGMARAPRENEEKQAGREKKDETQQAKTKKEKVKLTEEEKEGAEPAWWKEEAKQVGERKEGWGRRRKRRKRKPRRYEKGGSIYEDKEGGGQADGGEEGRHAD